MVSVYPLLLFGGGSLVTDLYKSNFVLSLDDGWIRFMAATKQVGTMGVQSSGPFDLNATGEVACMLWANM